MKKRQGHATKKKSQQVPVAKQKHYRLSIADERGRYSTSSFWATEEEALAAARQRLEWGAVYVRVDTDVDEHRGTSTLVAELRGSDMPSSSRHHSTKKKSSAQLNREIAEVLGSWEEDPFGGYRFITTNEGVRFDTAGVDPTYYRDPKWRQRWEFDLKREIEKFKAGKPTKLYKMSETHYRLPGTV